MLLKLFSSFAELIVNVYANVYCSRKKVSMLCMGVNKVRGFVAYSSTWIDMHALMRKILESRILTHCENNNGIITYDTARQQIENKMNEKGKKKLT